MDLTSDYGTTKETDNYTDNFKLNLKKLTRMQAIEKQMKSAIS